MVVKKNEVFQEDNDDGEHGLLLAMSLLRNAEEARQFLHDICTPAEREAMADRWRVVDPIKQGLSYRKIHQQTGVSVSTVGRVARYISHGSRWL